MCFKNVFVEPAKYNASKQQNDTTTESHVQFPDYPSYSNECSLDLFDPLSIFNETTSPMSLTSDSDFPVTDFYNQSQERQDADYGSKPIFCGYTRPPEYAYQTAFTFSDCLGYLQTPSLGPEANQFTRSPCNYDQSFDFAVTPAKSLHFTGNVQTQSLCKVCGDIASGNHFGVLSCEACKSFFRRSVRASARYACRASRRCTIEKLTRNRCQYCRLQKCILMGMKKEVVQEERTPPVSQVHMLSKPTSQTLFQNSHRKDKKSTHSCSLSSSTTTEPTSNLISKSRKGSSLPNLKIAIEQETMQPSLDGNSSLGSLIHSVESVPVTQNNVDSQVSASILVNADLQSDRHPVENVTTAEGSVTVEEIFEGARQSLMKVIEWGKQIPAFTALKLEEQIMLLKSSWFEHVLMRLAIRIRPEFDTVLLGSGLTCYKDQIEDPEISRIIEEVSNDISYWFDTMHVDHVEMACLKGIILFNPDAIGLSAGTRKRVEIFQEQILQALETRCRTVYPATPLRFSKLLLRLAPLKTSALRATQHMEIERTLCKTKMDDIFGELLDLH